jgi:hypothetical protein
MDLHSRLISAINAINAYGFSWNIVQYTKHAGKSKSTVRAVLEHCLCAVGNTTEAWSYCISKWGSDVLRVWFRCPFVLKNSRRTGAVQRRRATSVPSSLTQMSALVTVQFLTIFACARCLCCSFLDVCGRPDMFASAASVRLLLNISIHLYTLYYGKQFCPYVAANCRWVLPLSYHHTSGNIVLHVAWSWCNPLVEHSSLHHAYRAQTGAEPHSQRATIWPWTTAWPDHGGVPNNKTKIFQYYSGFLIHLCFYWNTNKIIRM